MTYREIAGEKVSLLGFGCMRFPTLPDGKIDPVKTEEMLTLAYESGVNYYDTAWPYHGGESEIVTSNIMSKFPRNSYHYATKLPVWAVNSLDDAKNIFAKQLEKLKTDYVDFYLIHALGRDKWKQMLELGVIDYFEEQQKLGRIKHYGFSFHDEYDVFKDIIYYRKWEFCQIQLNYMDTEYQAGLKGVEDCVKQGTAVVVMEPVKGGSLASFPDDVMAPLRAANPDDSASRWALRYVASIPQVSVVLSGMTTLDQVKDNLATFEDFKPLSNAEQDIMSAHIERIKNTVNIGCTWCNYCMPCPQGVNIPRIFGLWNNYAKYHNPGDINWQWSREIPESQKPANCISCGACEEHCPQHLPIIESLKKADSEIKAIVAGM
jgi:predicted aldo/keto reductase-like oxidoreductase